MFKSFTKYIEERKETGLVGNPKVKLVADYEGPYEKNPPKNKDEKGSKTPYKTPINNEDPNKNQNKDGFAMLGDKKLIYNPDTKGGNSKLTALGKEISSDWCKDGTKSENNYLSSKQLTEDHSLPTIDAPTSGPIRPNINETIRYIVSAGKKYPKIIENFIFDAKRNGLLDDILKFALDHNESYNYLGDLLSGTEGEIRSKNLARALQKLERVVPYGLNSQDDNHDDMNTNHNDNEDMNDDEDDTNDMSDMDDMDHEDDHDQNMDDTDETDEDSEDSDDEHPDEGDFEDDEHIANSGEDMNPPPMMKKSANQNLFNAMKSYMNR